jgi:alanine-synthesizing transaminase
VNREVVFAARTAWDRSPSSFAEIVSEARARRGADLVDLTESNPTRVGLASRTHLVRELGDPRGTTYDPDPKGHPRARRAVAAYYADRGLSVAEDRVLLSASTSESYSWIFRLLCDPGDEVLVPAPSYPLFGFLADVSDVVLRSYPLVAEEGFRPDLEAIRANLGDRTRAVVAVHPNNPTGTMLSVGEAEELDGMLSAHGCALVVDEVFGDYVDAGARPDRHTSFAGPRRALTFVLSGLSKVLLCPELKLGWTVVGGDEGVVREALGRLEIIADTFLSVSTPVQLALPALLGLRHQVQAELGDRLATNLAHLDVHLRSFGDRGIVRRYARDGGWYVVLEVPRTRSEDEWIERLALLEGLLVHPGHFYDMPHRGSLIVGLLQPPDVFEPAARRLIDCLHRC